MKRLIVGLVLTLSVEAIARADVILWDDEQIAVASEMTETLVLYDTSHASIVPDGSVPSLYANDASTVDVSGGSLGWPTYVYNQSTVTLSSGTMASLSSYNSSKIDVLGGTVTGYLRPYDESTVTISGGSVKYAEIEDSSTVHMRDGSVDHFTARDSSNIDISGGSVHLFQVSGDSMASISGGTIDSGLHTYGSSIVTLYVKDYRLGGELTLDGTRVLGTGILSGQWMDGTPRWTIDIATNDGAGIFISLVLPGDLDADGTVNSDDLDIIRANWGATVEPGALDHGDPSGDGTVGSDDLDIVRANWGAGLAAVPEANVVLMILTGSALSVCHRRRNDRRAARDGQGSLAGKTLLREYWLSEVAARLTTRSRGFTWDNN